MFSEAEKIIVPLHSMRNNRIKGEKQNANTMVPRNRENFSIILWKEDKERIASAKWFGCAEGEHW